jgi:hypothetical protein
MQIGYKMKKNRFCMTRIGYQERQGWIQVKQSQNQVKQSQVRVKQSRNREKTKPEQGCEIELWEEAKPTSVERFKEESVTKKDKVEKDGSPLDEGKTKPITEGDSVKGGDTIRTDWRLPLLVCIRDPGKTTDKKIKWQALKYTSLDDDIEELLMACYQSASVKSKLRWQYGVFMLEFVEHISRPIR